MIKISHEVPVSLLNDSVFFNDYHYCLPNFLDNKEYYDFFKTMSHNDIIMDNGLFEGVNINENSLIEIINDIKPDIFIVPDEWNDSQTTLKNAKRWIHSLKDKIPEKTQLMPVIQAKTISDAMMLYSDFIDLGYQHISINHSGTYLSKLCNIETDELSELMYGRIEFVTKVIPTLKGFNNSIYHHLLGATLPQEFKSYTDIFHVSSIDTSNPVIYGIKKGKYPNPLNLSDKINDKLELFFNDDLSENIRNNVFHNVNTFKYSINKPNYVSLFEFLKRPAGRALGEKVWSMAYKYHIPTLKRRVLNDNYKGYVVTYPEDFLDKLNKNRFMN